MKENLFRAIIDNNYKGDERQIGIRNKVYVWGFIGLCLGLLIYLYIDNIISAVSEFHLLSSARIGIPISFQAVR